MPTTPYVDHFSLHLDASLATPLGLDFRTSVLPSLKPSIFVHILMQIDTSTQLDLPKPFRGVGGAYIDLDCYLHHRLYF